MPFHLAVWQATRPTPTSLQHNFVNIFGKNLNRYRMEMRSEAKTI